ncbi:MAG: cytidylate kinase family protein [Christensenellales bacterium]
MSVITISRQMCSLGDEVAVALSQKLGWELIAREKLLAKFIADIASPNELHMLSESAKFYLNKSTHDCTFLEHLNSSLHEFVQSQPAILMGFGSQVLFAKEKNTFHVRMIAPKDVRIIRLRKQFRVSQEEAEQILIRTDKKHQRFVSTLFHIDLSDPGYYHLILNTADLHVDECVACIIAAYKEHEARLQMEKQTEGSGMINKIVELPVFKNPSEMEFAKILDMYQIDWKYEPKTFPIEWDAEGNVVSAFSPDFYLTKFDTYIELTTMNQKYVTEKNKKVKKLRELYPGVNIKIVYKKDFYSLIERFKTFS